MTNFNESKLSRIIARRIIVPEDRSQLLPLCTPIYCPTYKGVRASRVTVINPNTNSFLQDASLPNRTFIGSKLMKNNSRLASIVTNTGNVVINDIGEATGFGVGKFLQITDATAIADTVQYNVEGLLPRKLELDVDVIAISGTGYQVLVEITQNGNVNLTANGETNTIGKASLGSYFNLSLAIDDSGAQRAVSVRALNLLEDGKILNTTVTTPKTNITIVSFGTGSDDKYQMDLANSSRTLADGTVVPLYSASTVVANNPGTVSNTFDIDMTQSVRHSYFVPHEVDLETDVNLIDMIKSDFAVRFKKAVSDAILAQVVANVDTLTKLNMGDSVATAIGTVIADNMAKGTGQKYSIYKYDNGAPVVYTKNSSQPNIDDMAIQKEDEADLVKDERGMFKSDYALKDDVDVPALHYVEKPTLIFDYPKFEEYQQGLCSGAIRDYADKMVNVDTAMVDLQAVGEGIFGTNDTFAVAFTEPKITRVADKDYFADNICVEIYFGVTLVHTDNLRLFI